MLSTATALKKIDSVAIGGFDGMHIGHQRLFSHLGEYGAIVVIESGFANLTPHQERERFSRYPLFYYPLENIRHLEGAEFVRRIREDFPQLKRIVVGYDFHFGKNRGSSCHDLTDLFDGEVVVVEPVCHHGDSVHAHKIRAKLQIGDIAGANAFLGHNYTIHGSVIAGQGLGRRALVPTINLHVSDFLLPKEGVYATLTRIDDEEHYHPSVSFIGHRVTTDGSFAIESHLLDGEVSVERFGAISFLGWIRENRKFESLEALRCAIALDIDTARRICGQMLL